MPAIKSRKALNLPMSKYTTPPKQNLDNKNFGFQIMNSSNKQFQHPIETPSFDKKHDTHSVQPKHHNRFREHLKKLIHIHKADEEMGKAPYFNNLNQSSSTIHKKAHELNKSEIENINSSSSTKHIELPKISKNKSFHQTFSEYKKQQIMQSIEKY